MTKYNNYSLNLALQFRNFDKWANIGIELDAWKSQFGVFFKPYPIIDYRFWASKVHFIGFFNFKSQQLKRWYLLQNIYVCLPSLDATPFATIKLCATTAALPVDGMAARYTNNSETESYSSLTENHHHQQKATADACFYFHFPFIISHLLYTRQAGKQPVWAKTMNEWMSVAQPQHWGKNDTSLGNSHACA